MLEFLKNLIAPESKTAGSSDQDGLTVNLAVAVLLFDAAFADGQCSEDEKAHLTKTLVTRFGVSESEIKALFDAREKERREHVELFRYTRFLNDHFTADQKQTLLAAVWRIILLDGHLEAHEDHFAHRLADLLNLGHKELIDAKKKARRQLSEEQ